MGVICVVVTVIESCLSMRGLRRRPRCGCGVRPVIRRGGDYGRLIPAQEGIGIEFLLQRVAELKDRFIAGTPVALSRALTQRSAELPAPRPQPKRIFSDGSVYSCAKTKNGYRRAEGAAKFANDAVMVFADPRTNVHNHTQAYLRRTTVPCPK